jgi:hypothetical protein
MTEKNAPFSSEAMPGKDSPEWDTYFLDIVELVGAAAVPRRAVARSGPGKRIIATATTAPVQAAALLASLPREQLHVPSGERNGFCRGLHRSKSHHPGRSSRRQFQVAYPVLHQPPASSAQDDHQRGIGGIGHPVGLQTTGRSMLKERVSERRDAGKTFRIVARDESPFCGLPETR